MITVQLGLWYGVRPLLKNVFQRFCSSTGLTENTNAKKVKSNVQDEHHIDHTKLYHQKWLKDKDDLHQKNSSLGNDGAWIKEVFAAKNNINANLNHSDTTTEHYSRSWSPGLPGFFLNFKFLFKFRFPGLGIGGKSGNFLEGKVEDEIGNPKNSIKVSLKHPDEQNFINKIQLHLPRIDTTIRTKEDLIRMIESNSSDPFVLSMMKFKEVFGAQWPPRASFEDWPSDWYPYREMAEEMSFKMRDLETPVQFRVWLLRKCCKINIIQVKKQLADLWRTAPHSSAAYGLMGALAKLLFAFRWGKLPVTQEELDRKTLSFPPELMEVFEVISKHYGTMPRGSMFSTSFANAVYEKDKDGPQAVRFFFTPEEDMRQTETNFFNSFAHVDGQFGKCLPHMSRYMALTQYAREEGKEVAKLLLNDRVQCLEMILQHERQMFKTFRDYINQRKVKCKFWAPYIQAATAWNINGQTEGMSGAEIFGFNVLDSFLGIKGESAVFKASIKKLDNIPKVCRELIQSIPKEEPDRFQSFLDLEDDPILKVKEEILGALYAWRLGHIKVPAQYFRSDYKTTSGGVVEMTIGDESTSLVEETEKQLRLRAVETKACMMNKPRNKPAAG